MTKKQEEWQSTDSGYLNCIGIGDTYVRKQIERIMSNNFMDCSVAFRGAVCSGIGGATNKPKWGE